ncbi:non-ribosomal peptide synthetase [Amycolatopsis jejuensis]|uniref:non-ribosomal peptide synthetase n=1 Tax=Amycolatopsis jejuensis TaxID=330084 RepID=UPI00068B6E52|nr:non-ribosomal peptide synthetase [Amycolatopsis jejuensis]
MPHDPTDPAALPAVLADLLDIPEDTLDPGTDLIGLGLDSISIMRLSGAWRSAGRHVPFAELAAEPTLGAWQALLAAAGPASPAGRAEIDETAPFPLALMQHAYWAGRAPGQQLGGVAAHFYHEFDGVAVEPERLEHAVRAVFARHGMLRVQVLDDGTQQILDRSPWPGLRVHDLRALEPAAAESKVDSLRRELSHRRLDIGSGEVFDVQLSLLPSGTRVHVNLDMIAADALSLRVLLADLAAYYTGRDPAPLSYSYPRYLAEDAGRRGGSAADREYWTRRLPDLPGAPQLPAAANPADDATTVVRRHRLLDAAATEAFASASRRHGLTPAMALAAVFAEVLTAWSADPRFLLNLPLFDREPLHPDVAGLVGDFTSSVLLAWDGTTAGSFADRAKALQDRFHADVAHSACSGVEVLREAARLHGERILAPVVYTSALGLGPLFADDVRRSFGEPSWIISQGPQVWLDAQVTEFDGGLLLNWDAREDAFAPGVLDAMFTAYRELLDRLLAEPAAWTGPVSTLLPADQAAVRAEVNDTGTEPVGARLHDGFFAYAATHPDAVALRWGADGILGYGELAERALAVAGDLAARGVQPGDLVAVSLPKGPDQVVAVLGVLAAGAAYLPIGVDQPPARRERILSSAGARVVLTDVATKAPPLPAPVPGSADSLAYVLYTSGSTGTPKGVEVPHAAAMATIADLTTRFGLGPADATLALSALEFDLSVFDLFAPLNSGGAVVCVTEADRRDALAWARLLHTHRATVLNCVPALLDMLLTVLDAQPVPLRLALLGGDWVRPELAERLARQVPGCRFVALGGTTETAIHSTVREVTTIDPQWTSVPYGTPLGAVRCRVVDALGRDCPDWVPGELWIGGAGVALGYRGDPERTADRFVTHDGIRWYRTGDRARYHPDGNLEFLGRADYQVKIRGHRIELGEVEAALQAHPGVNRATAVLTADHRLGAVVSGPQPPDEKALRAFAATLLPSVMVPDRIANLGEFPLTGNGKIDRRALVTMLGTVGESAGSPPQTEAERAVAAAWRDVLGAGEVLREHDFFRLGGDSLLATRVLARLRADGFDGVALGTLFSHPVLADFATTLHRGAPAALAVLAANPADRHRPFPPTDVQQAYWLGRNEEFTLGGIGCHFYREYDIEDLDLSRLEDAVNLLVARHEMLRVVFDAQGEQRILPEVPRFRIEVTEAGDDPDGAFAAQREALSHQVFDPAKWPLFAIGAVRDGTRTRLAVGIDNLALDALSILTFYSELSRAYLNAELPAPGPSFRDYVVATATPPLEEDRRFWLERALPPAPQLPLAVDPAIVRPVFTRRRAVVDASQWRRITAQARAHGVTPSAVLLTAFAEVLGRWSAQPELTLVLTLFDRKDVHPEIGRVLGDFTSLLLVGYQPDAGQPWSERMRAVQGQLWESLDHRDFSAVRVLRELAQRTGSGSTGIPVVFTSALGVGADEGPGYPFTEQVWGVSQTPQVWLDHQVVEYRGGVELNWDAVEELFPAGLLDAMFEAYQELVRTLADGTWSAAPRMELPAAQAAERRIANDTAAKQGEAVLHLPFFQRARETPDAPAILGAGLTYREVAGRALRVAGWLSAQGIGPGDTVAVCLPKGPDQIVAVLGVLAAGAAYVPVGVDQPAARRDRIFAIAGVRLVLDDLAVTNGADPVPEPVPVSPDALAYLIFTSGSTGEPKGVEITHRAAANTVEDIVARYRIGAADRVLAVSALDFDLSVFDIFGLLGAGGAVVTIGESLRRDPRAWAELAHRHRVTVWNSVPALLEMLLLVPDPPDLRLVLVSGDWVGLDLPARLADLRPAARMIALGGATEASIWSNAFDTADLDPAWPSVPYGLPLRNQRYRVVDASGRDCPDWVPGELWIGGTGVARGYAGAAQLTTARFVEHDGMRWYRTGDQGRYRPGGLLEFLGRTDDQVKIRGYRIELGEVEAALTSHPAVSGATAVVAGGRLAAAVVGPVPAGEVLAHASTVLPGHMVPDQLLVLDRIPLSANGKVDRAQVAALLDDTRGPTGEPPCGAVENRIAALWRSVLDLREVGRDDSFFTLGGDSVRAIRFIEQAARELRYEIELPGFFADPTVRGVAARLPVPDGEVEEGVL